jgi:CRP-like cAMP-binding protein
LDQKFKIGPNLVEKLINYFNNYNADLEIETNQEMSYLLKILPSTLKTQLSKFLYQDAINVNRFLEDRDDNFYSRYLEELKTERFVKGDVIAKKGNRPEFVYFIMNGVVHNKTTNRYFEAGQMINHDFIMLQTPITEEYVAESDVSALKYEREIFKQILE